MIPGGIGGIGVWSIVAMYAVAVAPVSTGNLRSLRKIYPLREFRHLPAQLIHGREQFLAFRGGHRGRHRTVTEPLGECLPERRQGDHPEEESPHSHDRDEDADDTGVHLATSRPARRAVPRHAASRATVPRSPGARPARPCPAASPAAPPEPPPPHPALPARRDDAADPRPPGRAAAAAGTHRRRRRE